MIVHNPNKTVLQLTTCRGVYEIPWEESVEIADEECGELCVRQLISNRAARIEADPSFEWVESDGHGHGKALAFLPHFKAVFYADARIRPHGGASLTLGNRSTEIPAQIFPTVYLHAFGIPEKRGETEFFFACRADKRLFLLVTGMRLLADFLLGAGVALLCILAAPQIWPIALLSITIGGIFFAYDARRMVPWMRLAVTEEIRKENVK